MTEDVYQVVTRLAREFRAYRLHEPISSHPHSLAGDRLYDDWPELWESLDALQREWLE